MSSSTLECILPYLDIHKRLSISICSPKFRHLEKQTYIYFDELELEPSKIKIDEKYYKFGEILDIEKTSEEDDRNARRIKKSIRKNNFEGGNEWRSMEDDVLEPGDIFLKQSYEPRLEQQKLEKTNRLRHSFMEELEKYSNSEIMINPLDVFEHSVTECKAEWPIELKRMFDRIYRSSPFNMQGIFEKHQLLTKKKDHSLCQQEDLSDMYPNAFKLMKSKIEEMNHKDDLRVSVLEMLTYPPVTVPYFNQFTFFEYSPEYSIRIPDGFSIRKAFKHFLLVIFEERENMRVGKFKLKGQGILPLPVGLKFDCEEVDFSLFSEDGNATKVYETLVSSVNRINFPSWCLRRQYVETLNTQMVRNCKKLYIPSHRRDRIGSEFKFVNNEVLFIGIIFMISNRGLADIISNWTSNIDREIGSKLFIAYLGDLQNSDVTIQFKEFLEVGFTMKEDNNQSMYLPQNENKQMELTFHKNSRLVPREFLQREYFDYCQFIEVICLKR